MLILKNIKKEFRPINLRYLLKNRDLQKINVLNNLNLSVQDRNFVTVTGKNGSGKTTLMRIISGLLIPDSGEISFQGKSINKNEIAYINKEERSFFWRMSVINNLIFFQRMHNSSAKLERKDFEKINKLIGQFNLEKLKHRYFMSLSSGEKQKVNLIRAFLRDPKIFIFDEVASSLDKESRLILEGKLKNIRNAETNKLVLWVTHNPEEVMELSDIEIRIEDINYI